MRKSIAFSVIAVLCVAAIVFGALYFTNNAEKSKQIEEMKADVADKANQIAALTNDVSERDKEIAELKADVADKANQIATLTSDVSARDKEIAEMKADVAEKTNQINALSDSVSSLEGQIKTLTADVNNKKNQIDELSAAVAEMGSTEGKYKSAQSLMAEGKYEEAAAKFAELGSYEEASKLSMYCRAAAAGEKGDFNLAFSTFQLLGDFKESQMMLSYYNARQMESYAETWGGYWLDAAKLYDDIALFRDSQQRAGNCRQAAYEYAERLAKEKYYQKAIQVLSSLGDYNDSVTLKAYYDALRLEQSGAYREASNAFLALGDYRDAKEQATQVLQRGYDAADALEKSGDQLGAYNVFIGLGEYKDSFIRACKPYYDLGVSLRAEKKWDEAVTAFTQAGTYSDATIQIGATRYLEGETKRGEQKWDEAVAAFALAGSYSDSATQIKETTYQRAQALAEYGDYESALRILDTIVGYKDVDKLHAYYVAFRLGQTGFYRKASDAFSALGDYRDAKEQVTQVLQRGYDAADALEKNGDQQGAYKVFIGLGEYKDSLERACKAYYDLGISLRAEKKWDEAVAAFTQAGSYSDSATQITETTYQQAKFLIAEGNYSEALSVIDTIKGYKDVESLTREAQLGLFRTVGSYVLFGSYEQDNNTENGQEPIEWLVLDYDAANHRALLLSRYGLDAKPYNSELVNITWEKCALRVWLNGEFMSSAFSTKEQACILTTAVDNSRSQGYSKWDTDGGNNTQDKIFLQSYAEANKYLGVTYENSDNMKSRTSPTAYALQEGAWTNGNYRTSEGFAAGWWWLRSPGTNQYTAARVHNVGSLDYSNVSNANGCVRPALWINLESDIF